MFHVKKMPPTPSGQPEYGTPNVQNLGRNELNCGIVPLSNIRVEMLEEAWRKRDNVFPLTSQWPDYIYKKGEMGEADLCNSDN